MKKVAFDTLKTIEGTWWHEGRILALKRAMAKAGLEPSAEKVLDVGTGYGGMYDFLARYGEVSGVEKDDDARAEARERGYAQMHESLDEIMGRFGLVGAFDVIEHIEDDEAFVRGLHTVLLPEGHLIATVPAFPFLFGEHDREHMHFRRYTKKQFRTLIEHAGFDVRYIGFWNRTLFPIVALMRILGKSGESGLAPHPLVDRVLRFVMKIEGNSAFPFIFPGLSLVLVAKRREA